MISEYPKVYTHSLNDAIMSGEQSEWRESYHLNCHCAVDIERAIDDHYDGMRLDGGCAESVVEKYGIDRVEWVLAATVQALDHDGRISSENKSRAAEYDIPGEPTVSAYCVNSYPGLIDLFCRIVRDMHDEIEYQKSDDESVFEKTDSDEPQPNKRDDIMRVVYVEPHVPAYEAEIQNTLADMQRAVGGYIEAVYNSDGTVIVCNDEGKLIGMTGNRHVGDGTSVIAGPFFVCGVDGEDFCSLTDAQTEKYLAKFAQPEDISDDEVRDDMGMDFYSF